VPEPPVVSLVIPAFREGEAILPTLRGLAAGVSSPFEALVVVDFVEDETVPVVEAFGTKDPRFRAVINTWGRGPAFAIRYGVAQCVAPVVVVTMADGSDLVSAIDPMVRGVQDGAVIVSGSRYMRGGSQQGGPVLKGLLSRAAGLTLWSLAHVGTHDATNSFKAYDARFLEEVGVESQQGFELGIELVAKARRLRRTVGEVPTTWVDRTEGTSNFRLRRWLPYYLAWYAYAFGARLTVDEVRGASGRGFITRRLVRTGRTT
jgi:glycosyltransferase involved in cell wall biosynthesis